MTDHETPAGDDAPAPARPNAAALSALDTSARRLQAATARPPRNAPVVELAAAPAAAAADPASSSSAAAAPAAKRKHGASGKKKTRAELAELVKVYQSGAAAPVPAAAPVAPVIAGNPAKAAAFASGAARMVRAASRFAARRWGAHWEATDDESAAVGEAAADCLAAGEEMAPALTPWLQKAMRLAPFGILAAVSYDLIDSRLEIDASIDRGERPRIMPADPSPPRGPAVQVVRVS